MDHRGRFWRQWEKGKYDQNMQEILKIDKDLY